MTIVSRVVYQRDVQKYLFDLGYHNQRCDLAIIDPPYYGIADHEYDNQWRSLNDYLDWMKSVLWSVYDCMNKTGSVYLWGAIGYNHGYALPKLADWIEESRIFRVRNWITVRNTRGYGSKRGYMAAREELLFMTVSDKYTFHTPYRDQLSLRKDLGANGKPRKSTHKRVSDVWTGFAEASQSSRQRFKLPNGKTFPGTKSLQMCRRIVEASSNPGDAVLVPFCGTGSEVVTCELQKRIWYTTDTDPWCVQMTERRLESVK